MVLATVDEQYQWDQFRSHITALVAGTFVEAV
jgi:hypothetical protein